jgi:peptide/nickel transport system permease protein
MRKYVVRRLMLYIPTLLLASLMIFAAMRVLPGDVALVILGGAESSPSALAQLDSLRHELGLDDPFYVQYGHWAWSMVNGQFGGSSIIDREALSSIIARRLPVTLQLASYTLILSFLVSIPLGIFAAIRQNTRSDYTVRIVAVLGHALPNFWVALMIVLFLLLAFRWTPPIFYYNSWQDPWLHFQKMVWPTLVLAWGYSAYLIRITRSTMLEVLRQDYMRTAKSKGLMERVVVMRHGLPNALIPVITLGGLQVATLIGGTIIIETVFSLPGIGQGLVGAAGDRDFPVVQSLTMLLVTMMLTLNLVVDLLYAKVDPRISYA